MGKQFMSDDEFLRRIRGFNDQSLVNAIFLLAEEVAAQRYPRLFAQNKKKAMLKFFDDFTAAGHEVVDKGLTAKDIKADFDGFIKACDEVEVITDAIYDLAEQLAPEGISDEDHFIFGMSLLQEFLEAAGDVVAKREEK